MTDAKRPNPMADGEIVCHLTYRPAPFHAHGHAGSLMVGTNPGTPTPAADTGGATTPAPIPGHETATLDPVTVHHGGAWHNTRTPATDT
jgi:hypothetical protein